MRIAMFVEGSAPIGARDPCARLWNDTLLPALGRTAIDIIIPIGKDAITNMLGLPGSSSAPGLDTRICEARRVHGLDPQRDSLIIAWDLEPIDRNQPRCALDEKIGVYRGIAQSPLPLLHGTAWSTCAAKNAARLEQVRGVPPSGTSHSKLAPGSVLGLCMVPMFEGLFARDGRAVRRALDLTQDPPGWPTGWSLDERDPSGKLMAPAIAAMRRLRPKHKVRRMIRETWENAKDEWSEYFLKRLLADHTQAEHILDHEILRRLRHILPSTTS